MWSDGDLTITGADVELAIQEAEERVGEGFAGLLNAEVIDGD
jgi:hypothetical protein